MRTGRKGTRLIADIFLDRDENYLEAHFSSSGQSGSSWLTVELGIGTRVNIFMTLEQAQVIGTAIAVALVEAKAKQEAAL